MEINKELFCIHYPLTQEEAKVMPYASCVWSWGRKTQLDGWGSVEVAGRSHRARCESKNSQSERMRDTQRVGNLFSWISSFLPFLCVFVLRALCSLVSFLSPEEVSTALLAIRWGRQRMKTSWLHPGQVEKHRQSANPGLPGLMILIRLFKNK